MQAKVVVARSGNDPQSCGSLTVHVSGGGAASFSAHNHMVGKRTIFRCVTQRRNVVNDTRFSLILGHVWFAVSWVLLSLHFDASLVAYVVAILVALMFFVSAFLVMRRK